VTTSLEDQVACLCIVNFGLVAKKQSEENEESRHNREEQSIPWSEKYIVVKSETERMQMVFKEVEKGTFGSTKNEIEENSYLHD